MAGERLVSRKRQTPLIERKAGSAQATFHDTATGQDATFPLREPERISLPRFLDHDPRCAEAAELNDILRYAHSYSSRAVNLYRLRKFGSEAGHETWLRNNGQDLWSVLRNLHLKRDAEGRSRPRLLMFDEPDFSLPPGRWPRSPRQSKKPRAVGRSRFYSRPIRPCCSASSTLPASSPSNRASAARESAG